MTELVQLAAVIAVVAFALYIVPRSIDTVARARKDAPTARSLPWWYIGGQPDMVDPPDGDGADEPEARRE